jgi:dimethylglycine dehydrogenase
VLSEWIMHGESEMGMGSVVPRRYSVYADHDYCLSKALETYGHEYAMHFPHHEWPAGRDKKLSANHAALLASGGQMGAYNGWERANWFAKDGEDTSEESTQTWGRAGPWEAGIKREVEAVRDNVGVLDLPGFSRFALTGSGAAEWLRGQVAGALPKVGRMNLGYFTDVRGRVVTEMSIVRLEDDAFWLITAAAAQWHDFEFLRGRLSDDGSINLTDITQNWTTLIVSGPKSRDLLSDLTEADLSSGWLTHQIADVAGVMSRLIRVSFAGELGWEVHCAPEDSPKVYAALRDGGAAPFGMYALNSMRIEKGYRTWKGDLSTDYTLLEGGLGRFLRLGKEQDFPGKAALASEMQSGPKKGFVTLIVDALDADPPYMSPVWMGDEIVGETTSGDWGYRINKSVALGVVRVDAAKPGTELQVEIFGEKCKAVVQEDEPLWDPKNDRIRA